MKKTKYVYNPQTLKYEKYTPGGWSIFYKIAIIGIVAAIISIGISYTINHFFPSEKEKALLSEIRQMKLKYRSVNEQVGIMSEVISNIRNRDENVYKLMLGIAPIDEGLWNGGIGGHDMLEYNDIDQLIGHTEKKVSKLERQIVLQSKLIEDVEAQAKERSEKLAHTPSIKPVPKTALKYDLKLMSGFGMRIHPILKIKRMHTGIDFTCPTGTHIVATANGVVSRIEYSKTGYGKHVYIDHGFGYVTLYGHMNTIDVEEGDTVKRGQKIGTVGSTGTSTGPHVHYEVRYHGKPINPINYVMDGLSPVEYAELVRLSKVQNQSFD